MAERSEAHNTVRCIRVVARSHKRSLASRFTFEDDTRETGFAANEANGDPRRTSVDRPPPSARLEVCYFYISNPCSRRNNLFLPSIRLAGLCVHCETENFVRQRCCYAAGVARPLAKSFVVSRCSAGVEGRRRRSISGLSKRSRRIIVDDRRSGDAPKSRRAAGKADETIESRAHRVGIK